MLTGADIKQLKDYVKSNDGGMQNQAASTVRLHVIHSNLMAKFVEVRLDRHVSPGLLNLAAVPFYTFFLYSRYVEATLRCMTLNSLFANLSDCMTDI